MKRFLMIGLTILASSAMASQVVVDFEELDLLDRTFYPYPTSGETGFLTQDVFFPYLGGYNPIWDMEYWSGFVYSKMTDNKTSGFGNQYSAITGGGFDGSENYVVAYPGFGASRITLPTNSLIHGARITNTTYAALEMQTGSGYSKKFEVGDYFKLLITGLNSYEVATGTIEVLLAEGTNILNVWKWVDLSDLGLITYLEFGFESSDFVVYEGQTLINTPTYFAMDNLTYTIPEPTTLLLMGLGMSVLLKKRNA